MIEMEGGMNEEYDKRTGIGIKEGMWTENRNSIEIRVRMGIKI